jgi:hypothetical protein
MNLGSVEVPHVDWSSDGKTIVFVRRKLNNDLILIDLPR